MNLPFALTFRAALLCAALVLPSVGLAAPVSIANHSFEDLAAPNPGNWSNNLPNWDEDGLDSNGAFVDHLTGFSGEGTNHLGINSIALSISRGFIPPGTTSYRVSQDLNVTLQPNTIYELTVAVGKRNTFYNPPGGMAGFGLALGDGTLLAEGVYDAAPLPDATFVDQSITYTTGPNPAAGNVFVSLRNLDPTGVGARSHFDNIRLTADPIPGPFIVINKEDSGEGSLRRAIMDAPSGETITFADTLDGKTITLEGQILINKNLGIDASNLTGGIIIDGNANGRIFEITGNSTVTFDSLTLTNGLANWGGAIYVASGSVRLTLNNTTLSGNTAYDDFSGYGGSGGGIYNYGTLTLNNSTLSANTAAVIGGGIFNDGTVFNAGLLTLNNTTLSENSAEWGGGGIYEWAGTLTLNNSTLSGNSAISEGSGGFGGGIYGVSGDSDTLNNSIVAGNTSSSSDPNIFGSFTDYNNLTSEDPLIAPLGDYGGPTQTMPPLPGSPAIDSGGTPTLLTDQRGLPRIVGAGLDIGAYETGSAAGYAAWAVERIASGHDMTYTGDAEDDGSPNGGEYALGTLAFVSDPASVRTPTATENAEGDLEITFGFNPDAAMDTAWVLKRSIDMIEFDEIYRYDGPTDDETPTAGVTAVMDADRFTVTDTNAFSARVFYQFVAEPS